VATILVAMWLVRAGQHRERVKVGESESAA